MTSDMHRSKATKIITIIGARPQFIKAAPVSRVVIEHNRHSSKALHEVLVHTGQHYDKNMSQVFFDELNIPQADYNLGLGGGHHGVMTGQMLERIEAVLFKERPDWVIVYGDTNSTLAGALAAAKLHIPVAHVEAGLRSFNRRMPEEINRVLTDHISSLLYCPTETAVKNLAAEGITKDVHLVGDVMYDALLYNIQIAEKKSSILAQLSVRPKGYLLATVHRAENTDERQNLKNIMEAFYKLACSGEYVIFPAHPRTQKKLADMDDYSHAKLLIIDPVPYLDMLVLEKNAKMILTDSGGVQKEGFWFHVPTLTLREETEWVETIESGWNRLVCIDPDSIVEAVISAKEGNLEDFPFGCGEASVQIVELLLKGSN